MAGTTPINLSKVIARHQKADWKAAVTRAYKVGTTYQEAAVLTIGSGNQPCPPSVTDSFTKGEELYSWMEWTLTTSVMQLTQIYKFLLQKENRERRRKKTRITNIGTNRCRFVRPMGQDIASGCCTKLCYCLTSNGSSWYNRQFF